jgi:hypothetical protein
VAVLRLVDGRLPERRKTDELLLALQSFEARNLRLAVVHSDSGSSAAVAPAGCSYHYIPETSERWGSPDRWSQLVESEQAVTTSRNACENAAVR